ncbi:MAG: MBL fold metallo-hydrolase [Acidobacteriota bacterium]
MVAIALQSGSSGNCIYVEAAGTRLLVDAGISGRQAEQRLSMHGRSIHDVDALLITHDHADHASRLGVFQRKFGLPVFLTRATLHAASERCALGQVDRVQFFRAGQALQFGSVRVETVPTPHDGADGVACVIEACGKRLGILTDLGHVFYELPGVVSSLDAVFIESNYDPEMLERGSYPDWLKRRIVGPRGHISNIEAAELLRSSAGRRMKWACLSHLSGENNEPSVAMDEHRSVLGSPFPIYVASRYEAVGPFFV